MTVHHGPHVDLSLVDVLHHPDCPDDGPVLVVVPLALHAEHGAPLVLLIPLLLCLRKLLDSPALTAQTHLRHCGATLPG